MIDATRALSDRVGPWLTAGALAVNLILIVGLIGVIAAGGISHFRQPPLVALELASKEHVLGEIRTREVPRRGPMQGRERVRVFLGNRDLDGLDFRWIPTADIVSERRPIDALLIERREWGRFHGYAERIEREGRVIAQGPDLVAEIDRLRDEQRPLEQAIRELEQDRLIEINEALETIARTERARPESRDTLAGRKADLEGRYADGMAELARLRAELAKLRLVARTEDGREKEIALEDIVRVVQPNDLSTIGAIGLAVARVVEFVADEPRESNTEGGIFPAIFGTILMVLLTSIAVAPFGVLAAVYLREYARGGIAVRAIRIAVNSLAGVPSIVFGVFGLGFFVYLVGGSIDQLFYADALPAPTFGTGGILWASLTLALLTVPVVIVSTEEGIAAVPRAVREGSLALGATRFETLWRVVLPASVPGILTGLILAIARAAGEVAPLMIVGMVKLAPALPIDAEFPYIHFERKFMHLGFHIYDVGFQSPNVEAVQPLVYATALLLIGVVIVTNLTAILLRNRLRARYATSAV